MDCARDLEKPLVSFCISCYNQERYIAQALESAFAQTYGNMEIVISDDCSTDGTVGAIKDAIAKYQKTTAGGGYAAYALASMKKTSATSATGRRYVRLRKGSCL
ncbi:MAG: glycosyltransferase [Kiritimatiellae bacterium]|nr:glycosyltransferase [Kiritimatiellia bacterium]